MLLFILIVILGLVLGGLMGVASQRPKHPRRRDSGDDEVVPVAVEADDMLATGWTGDGTSYSDETPAASDLDPGGGDFGGGGASGSWDADGSGDGDGSSD